jgi:Fur family transcriptional regulator, ferric uptake regulator
VVTTDWQSDLRRRGYRLTPQRQLVLQAVDALEHATPDDILGEVRRTAAGVNISTVYRTLELLEELGLVSHAHLGHGAPTYHLAHRHRHMHLVCRDCARVIEADVAVAAAFTEQLRETFGFRTDMKHFAIFGRCAECSARVAEAGGDPAASGRAPVPARAPDGTAADSADNAADNADETGGTDGAGTSGEAGAEGAGPAGSPGGEPRTPGGVSRTRGRAGGRPGAAEGPPAGDTAAGS